MSARRRGSVAALLLVAGAAGVPAAHLSGPDRAAAQVPGAAPPEVVEVIEAGTMPSDAQESGAFVFAPDGTAWKFALEGVWHGRISGGKLRFQKVDAPSWIRGRLWNEAVVGDDGALYAREGQGAASGITRIDLLTERFSKQKYPVLWGLGRRPEGGLWAGVVGRGSTDRIGRLRGDGKIVEQHPLPTGAGHVQRGFGGFQTYAELPDGRLAIMTEQGDENPSIRQLVTTADVGRTWMSSRVPTELRPPIPQTNEPQPDEDAIYGTSADGTALWFTRSRYGFDGVVLGTAASTAAAPSITITPDAQQAASRAGGIPATCPGTGNAPVPITTLVGPDGALWVRITCEARDRDAGTVGSLWWQRITRRADGQLDVQTVRPRQQGKGPLFLVMESTLGPDGAVWADGDQTDPITRILLAGDRSPLTARVVRTQRRSDRIRVTLDCVGPVGRVCSGTLRLRQRGRTVRTARYFAEAGTEAMATRVARDITSRGLRPGAVEAVAGR